MNVLIPLKVKKNSYQLLLFLLLFPNVHIHKNPQTGTIILNTNCSVCGLTESGKFIQTFSLPAGEAAVLFCYSSAGER